jgi:hypothetical protein
LRRLIVQLHLGTGLVPTGTETKTKETKPPEEISGKAFDEAYKKAMEEISKCRAGQSSVTKLAVHFSNGRAPVLSIAKRMKEHPTRASLREFVVAAKQDINMAMAQYFCELFKEIVPEVETWI